MYKASDKRMCELGKGKKVPSLSKDTVKVGRINFYGVPDQDIVADIIVVERKYVGVMLPVSKDIERLLNNKDSCDPTDLDRIEAHAKRAVDEEYIAFFARTLENDFKEEIIDNWRQVYGYRYVPKEKRHVRIVLLYPPTSDDLPTLHHIAKTIEDHFKEHGPLMFDVAPSYGANAFRVRDT